MEFGKHLGKGIWGIAGRGLPVVYGISYVVLVVRVLPEVELGNFVLVQETFLVLANLAAAFALQPLLKFASEASDNQADTIGAALLLNFALVVLSSILVVAFSVPLASVLNAPDLEYLLLFVPLMLTANFVRNFTLVLLQAHFKMKEVFWVDAAHFLAAPVLTLISVWMHMFDSALDLIAINLASLSLSSLVGVWLAKPILKFTMRPSAAEVRKIWDFGKFSSGNILSTLFYSKADYFILSAFNGPSQVALYNSVKVFVRIYDMVPQVIQLFVLPAVSRLSSMGDLTRLKAVVEKAITFTTIAMVPIFFVLVLGSPLLINVAYSGKYSEAALLLQIFSVLSFLMPVTAVVSNVMLGLGQVRLNFLLNMRVLAVSLLLYLLTIPFLGALGATLGFVLTAAIQCWWFTTHLNNFVPVSFRECVGRTRDIWVFVRTRLPGKMP